MQWFPGECTRSLIPYVANTGMCRWTERCQSTESRHTRHKRAIIKRHLISTNRDIHLYIIQIKTPGGGGGVGGGGKQGALWSM